MEQVAQAAPPRRWVPLAAASAKERSRAGWALLIALLALAAVFRLYRLGAPGVLVEREYVSAIFARAFYYEHAASIEPWRVELARTLQAAQPVLEPPLTEFLVSLVFRVTGQESLGAAHVLTSSFWLIGGLFLFSLARRLLSTSAAVLATAYYLFVPSGILVSRSFQPDALMMLLFLASLDAVVRYFDRPAAGRLLLAAALAGVTLLLRPLVVFALYAAFVSLSISQKGLIRGLVNRPLLIFGLTSLVLPGLYYGYGILIAGYMQWKVTTSFLPYLFLRPEYWREWFLLAVEAAGSAPLIAAILGFGLLRRNLARPLVIGLSVGYVLFGLVFNYHISTHGYYHIQLLPIVALSAAPLFDDLLRRTRLALGRWAWLPVTAAAVLIGLVSFTQVRDRIGAFDFESPQTAEAIGQLVGHSDRTVFLAYHYGVPLEYYGELAGAYWPRSVNYWLVRRPEDRALTLRERLDQLGFTPEYFVITDFAEYERHHADLRAYLEQACEPLAETRDYLVYQRCNLELAPP